MARRNDHLIIKTGTFWMPRSHGGRNTVRLFEGKMKGKVPVIDRKELIASVVVAALVFLLLLLIKVVGPDRPPFPLSFLVDPVTIGFLTLGAFAITRSTVRTSGIGGSIKMMGSMRNRAKLLFRSHAPDWAIRLFRSHRVQLGHVISCYPSPTSGQNGQPRTATCFFTLGLRPMDKFPSPEDPVDNAHITNPRLCAKREHPFPYLMWATEGVPAPVVRRIRPEDAVRDVDLEHLREMVAKDNDLTPLNRF